MLDAKTIMNHPDNKGTPKTTQHSKKNTGLGGSNKDHSVTFKRGITTSNNLKTP